jgi:hypothetical protein
MKPAAPGRPPVGAYRSRPARTFRQPPQRRGSDGKGWGVVIGLALLAVFLVWPGWAWHGQTATGGYRWDGESTAAMLIWWGIVAFWLIVAGLVRQANAKRAKPQPPPQIRQAPRPACTATPSGSNRRSTRTRPSPGGARTARLSSARDSGPPDRPLPPQRCPTRLSLPCPG